MYDARLNLTVQVVQESRNILPTRFTPPPFPGMSAWQKRQSWLPVGAYDRTSRGAVAYHALAEEVMQKDETMAQQKGLGRG